MATTAKDNIESKSKKQRQRCMCVTQYLNKVTNKKSILLNASLLASMQLSGRFSPCSDNHKM